MIKEMRIVWQNIFSSKERFDTNTVCTKKKDNIKENVIKRIDSLLGFAFRKNMKENRSISVRPIIGRPNLFETKKDKMVTEKIIIGPVLKKVLWSFEFSLYFMKK